MNTHHSLTIAQIARMCHEANRAYCAMTNDAPLAPWGESPQWQKDSAISGVRFHLLNPHAGDDASHNNWLKDKRDAGWKWGPVKDPSKFEHPCMVPFEDLPGQQKLKDRIFRAMVHTLAGPDAYVEALNT